MRAIASRIVSPLASEESNRLGLDEALDQFGDGSRKRSATQLLQEYLNADDEALWGIVTDGSVLRIMRDNASLTRPAWIEINFEKEAHSFFRSLVLPSS